ncbi:MAG: TrpB-like pyridoxal phosphate-dependent enzyme [Actinomycetota bacterium]|nr:TrpB-like pyridoxal phosphate-dependent enzyme [Chloroflexota bacterium]MDQ2699261.1 TrpB-like pyridoxal phosphate-dependent enzyme [Actinomycetota bacterium]
MTVTISRTQRRFVLPEDELPTHYYNIAADLPAPLPPPLHPATREPIGPEALAPLFPMELIRQEVSAERFVEIPEEVREAYRIYRPSPLHRATALEKALDTPARIYFKNEGVSPAGSHKPNTAIAQAFYNREEGVTHLVTETGAGQWGSALAFACSLFGLDARVFMVKVSYEQKPYRRSFIQSFGATVVPSPSSETNAGRAILASDPDSTGSLGIAISEAVEVAATRDDTNYSLGSVLNHVLLHQTVIGQEAIRQMEMAGDEPDVVIGCAGGGSNFAGIAFPFLRDRLTGEKQTRFLAVEPASCPSLTKGEYRYDFGDTAGTTPLLKMHTLGNDFRPAPIHAGGLRYHGMAPMVSHLYELGYLEARAYAQNACFEAAIQFARTEGLVPAPESSHAIRAAIDEALDAREAGEERVILFNLSGHGHFDMAAYDAYLAGELPDVTA